MASIRRDFLTQIAGVAGMNLLLRSAIQARGDKQMEADTGRPNSKADYKIVIAATPVEIARKKFISTITYNGQFPGPLLRFKEGQQVTVDVINDTDTPEQLHWHGQLVPATLDGAAEEGTPFIPAHGIRQLVFTPRPAGFRFYHTHKRGGPTSQQVNTVVRSAQFI